MFLHTATPATSDRGASSVEYALLIMLVAAVIITVVALLGLNVLSLFESVQDGWDSVSEP